MNYIFQSLRKNKKLFSNFTYLTIVRFLEYILPILTIPYLSRIFGPDKFGLISFIESFVMYFVLIEEYSFNMTGPRDLAKVKNNNKKLGKCFWEIYFSKLLLMMIATIIFFIIILLIPSFLENYKLFFLAYFLVVSRFLFPTWFFQGIEDMKYITYVNIFIKLILLLLIFTLIKDSSDVYYYVFFNSLISLLGGVLSVFLIKNNYDFPIIIPSFKKILFRIKRDFEIFISRVAINIYSISGIFLLGVFTNNTAVGYFSSAYKVEKAVQGLITPFSQSIYPHISNLVEESHEKALVFIKKSALLSVISTFFISILLFIFSSEIIKFVFGSEYLSSIVILKILSPLPFIINISNIFGTQIMLNFNMEKQFSRIISLSSLLYIIILFPLLKYEGVGVAISTLITETLISVSMFIILIRKSKKV